ncbi:hypothetical protein SDC9_90393 [bioreactor metagenome]|uniref:Uncharacterized protein n=1 Tax=bioreactor metagenome TaxID=1076179 RepID=A0A644ZSJ6_9ZZZZ
MLDNHIFHQHTLTHCSRSGQIGSRFDAVRYHRVSATMQALHAFDPDDVCTGSADFCPHVVQQDTNINDFRLFGHILNDCFAFCFDRRQDDVDRRSDRNHIKIDALAFQPLFRCSQVDGTHFVAHCRAQRLETFDVLIDRSGAQETTSRQPDDAFTKFRKDSSHEIIRSTQAFDFSGRHRNGNHVGRIDCDDALILFE